MQPDQRRLPRSLELSYFADITANLDCRDFVEGVLQDGEFSLVFGESGCGKTFFATDLAFAVARGKPWRDREIDAGGVVYVAAEGAAGINARIDAYRIAEGLQAQSIPFAVIASPLNLRADESDSKTLIARIGDASTVMGVPVRLIVLDTISRVLAGGDENSSEAMGALVMNLDRLRHSTRAHVMGVHHSGKDSSKGARGHSLLRAAVDTEIEVTRNNTDKISTARVTKQRELETVGEWSFRLSPIELGINRRGKPVTSCIVEPVMEISAPRRSLKLSAGAKLALDCLRDCIGRDGQSSILSNHVPSGVVTVQIEAWRAYLKSKEQIDLSTAAGRMGWKRLRQTLEANSLIGSWEGLVWIV